VVGLQDDMSCSVKAVVADVEILGFFPVSVAVPWFHLILPSLLLYYVQHLCINALLFWTL